MCVSTRLAANGHRSPGYSVVVMRSRSSGIRPDGPASIVIPISVGAAARSAVSGSLDLGERSSPLGGGWGVVSKVVPSQKAGHAKVEGVAHLVMVDEEALGPAAAPVEDVNGLGGGVERARVGGREFGERFSFPGLVGAAHVEEDVGAALAELLDAGLSPGSSDLEDVQVGPVGDVGRGELEHPGRVAHALTARRRTAGAQRSALLGRLAAAPALARPHRLTSTARCDRIG